MDNCSIVHHLRKKLLNQRKGRYSHYFFCHTGIDVCLGATTPPEQGPKYTFVFFAHSAVSFRHTKQNSTLHLGQTTFLHFRLLCSTNEPQVGHARIEGQPLTPFTDSKMISLQFLRVFIASLLHPLLSQWSDCGREPFQSLKHCQQNS